MLPSLSFPTINNLPLRFFLRSAIKFRGERESWVTVAPAARGSPFGGLLLNLAECRHQALSSHSVQTGVSSVGDRALALCCPAALYCGRLKPEAHLARFQAQQIRRLDSKECSQL